MDIKPFNARIAATVILKAWNFISRDPCFCITRFTKIRKEKFTPRIKQPMNRILPSKPNRVSFAGLAAKPSTIPAFRLSKV